jgi:hypothetical protein
LLGFAAPSGLGEQVLSDKKGFAMPPDEVRAREKLSKAAKVATPNPL